MSNHSEPWYTAWRDTTHIQLDLFHNEIWEYNQPLLSLKYFPSFEHAFLAMVIYNMVCNCQYNHLLKR